MDITFDAAKNIANLAKHGVALGFGAAVFADDNHIVLASIRLIDGEERFKAVGMIEGRLWTAVHVYRGNSVRLISVRRSNQGEERVYHHSG